MSRAAPLALPSLLMFINPPIVEREDTLAEFARFERRDTLMVIICVSQAKVVKFKFLMN